MAKSGRRGGKGKAMFTREQLDSLLGAGAAELAPWAGEEEGLRGAFAGGPVVARSCRPDVQEQGAMNKTEERYAAHLDLLLRAGKISGWVWEPVKLRLGTTWKTSYRPDFMVIRLDGVLEFHEVKGHWEDDAIVKIKMAARLHPFVFLAVTESRKGGPWDVTMFTREACQPKANEAGGGQD